MSKDRKIGRRLFIGILAFHILVEVVLGMAMLLSFSTALEAGFGIAYRPELEVLGTALGLMLLFLSAVAVFGIRWTAKRQAIGVYLGWAVGAYIMAFGVVAFIRFGNVEAIYVDAIRGALTLIFGWMALKELKSN